jgi:choline dehydrogenase
VITGSGQELSFYATREVIVSQGVFESPKLLMLSGIGPAPELAKHNIPVIVDSRHVGQHLLDHPGVPFVLRLKDNFSMDNHVLRKGPLQNQTLAAYSKGHAGAMGSPFLELTGFPRIDKYLEKSQSTARQRLLMADAIPSVHMASLISSLISSLFLVVPSSGTSHTPTRAAT